MKTTFINKIIQATFINLLILNGALAQKIEWVKQNEGKYGHQSTTEISVNKEDGSIYLAGVTFDDDADNNTTFDGLEISASSGRVTKAAFYLTKYNTSGKIQWLIHSEHDKTSKGYHGDVGCSQAKDKIALSGSADKAIYFDNQEFVTPSIRYFAYVASFDTSGKFNWLRKAYPSVSNAGGAYAGSPLADDQGNMYLFGQYDGAELTFDGSNDKTFPETSNSSLFLVKYDESGNYQWGLTANGTGSVRTGTVTSDNEGHLYFSGTNSSDFEITDQNGNTTGFSGATSFIAKVDVLTGGIVWVKPTYGNDVIRAFAKLVVDKGILYSVGSLKGTQTIGSITKTSQHSSYNDLIVSRYNEDGNIYWAKSVFNQNSGSINATDISSDENGGIFVCADVASSSTNTIEFHNKVTLPGKGSFLAKYDSDGNYKWAIRSAGNDGDFNNESMDVDKEKNIYVSGNAITTLSIGEFTINNPDNNSLMGLIKISDKDVTLPPTTSGISGPALICENEQGITFSTQYLPDVTYTWTVPDGVSVTEGAGTHAITVNWGSTTGEVSFTASNGASASKNIEVLSTPVTSIIDGPDMVTANAGGLQYSVDLHSGSSYQWTVPSGAIVINGQGTNMITVNFGSASGKVSVQETNCVGTSETKSLDVEITADPFFSLEAKPAGLNVTKGQLITTQINVNALNGFNESVNLEVSNLPSGITASFNPDNIVGEGSSTLTLTASQDALVGQNTIKVTGSSTSLSENLNIDLSVQDLVGIKANKLKNLIYPNPANDLLNIETEESIQSVQIYNLTGKIALQSTVSGKNLTLDVSGLTKGMYLISIVSKDGTMNNHKLIVE